MRPFRLVYTSYLDEIQTSSIRSLNSINYYTYVNNKNISFILFDLIDSHMIIKYRSNYSVIKT